ncbi:cupin domain-containing protein [Dyadobacter flavalbus]|uniref:Cupin domain-containing protein n=1 Tax=Dyadobacter flavalbus TaxID=2579942 RepID=A0A5M8QZP4_9BACT|nr:cupin domain-containing protein [Dyadobacter flavalbus]KAA6440881.1 cupin domain-containing protein [Dyadobacter flavalbus]
MKKRFVINLTAIILSICFCARLCAQQQTASVGSADTTRNQSGGFITGGQSSVSRLPRVAEINCGVSTVSFGPGARTIWHSHAGGQVIVVTKGTAWYQEKGKPKQILRQGEAIIAPPGAMHWHGAPPDSAMVHTVATPNLDKGGVTSGLPVTNQEYLNP